MVSHVLEIKQLIELLNYNDTKIVQIIVHINIYYPNLTTTGTYIHMSYNFLAEYHIHVYRF